MSIIGNSGKTRDATPEEQRTQKAEVTENRAKFDERFNAGDYSVLKDDKPNPRSLEEIAMQGLNKLSPPDLEGPTGMPATFNSGSSLPQTITKNKIHNLTALFSSKHSLFANLGGQYPSLFFTRF